MKKLICFLSLFCFWFIFTGCQLTTQILSPDQVSKMTVNYLPNKNQIKKTVYTRRSNYHQIKQFVKAYNQTKPYRDDVGTTHPVQIILSLDNEEEIIIWGGTQGFQTVLRGNGQHNITGKDLNRYFEGLVSGTIVQIKGI